jgi:Zn-dependent metalloprotease
MPTVNYIWIRCFAGNFFTKLFVYIYSFLTTTYWMNIFIRYFTYITFALLTLFSANAQQDVHIEFHGYGASQLVKNAAMVRWNSTFSLPNYVEFRPENRPPVSDSKNILLANFKNIPNIGFVACKSEIDQLGWAHKRYQQTLSNIPIEGSMIIVHSVNDEIISYNGEMYSGVSVSSITPKVSEKQALVKALGYIGAYDYKWQLSSEENALQLETGDNTATYYPKGTLVIKAAKNNLEPGYFHLCWKFNIYAQTPLGRYEMYVSAENGAIIDDIDLIHTGNSLGKAATKYSGTQTMNTDSTAANNFRLRQTTHGKGIETYNLKKTTTYGSAVDFIDNDNYWNNANANKDEVATDAHWGSEQTYTYYKTVHNRKSFDNKDAKLLSYVHYSTNYDNAFWDGQRMTYGDGQSFKPLTALDITGHEITHGVTSNTANLTYRNESGALNESFSDIFGTAIEFFAKGSNANFSIGEDVTNGGLRNMALPSIFKNPGAYFDANWWTSAGDNGGVHTNSGVQNKWFYILVKGENSTNFKGLQYNVTGLGMDSAAKITYRSLVYYLTPNSKYFDARFYSIIAAKDLYGSCSDAVVQTTNAWAAVNVGAKYDTTVKANFLTTPTTYCNLVDSVYFTNYSENAASATWYFGDGQSSTNRNATHLYGSFGTYTVKLVIVGCKGGIDSIAKVNYIKVDSSLGFCKSVLMPKNGSGNTQTKCSGAIKDDGGDLNYTDGSDGVLTISPTNASSVKLTFSAFSMDNNGDYLYVYDGPSTASKLIARYSGTALPNGGTIVSTTSSITLRQVSNNTTNSSGFEISWECFQKISDDLGIISVSGKTGRANTSIALTNTENITINIKNFGSNSVSNIPVSYTINGGSPVNEVISQTLKADSLLTYTFATKANLSAAGDYSIVANVSLIGDSINKQDNVLTKILTQIENNAVKLPYYQTFETDADISLQEGVLGLDNTTEFDYENNTPGSGRLRTNAGSGFAKSGVRAITFDQNPASASGGPFNINYLILTLNMSNYTSDKILLDFSYMSSGDESNNNDKVWARANDQSSWLEVYNLFNNKATDGTYKDVVAVDLSSFFQTASQTLGSSFQLRFGQEDNGTCTGLSANDGFTFDNIRVWRQTNDVAVTELLNPENACGLSSAEKVKVEITNMGYFINDTVEFNYQINGGNVVTEKRKISLIPKQVYQYTFNTNADLSIPKDYAFKVWTRWSKDEDTSNDSISATISSFAAITPIVITPSGALNFCGGDSVILSANTGYSAYIWNNGEKSSSVIARTSGVYNCTVTNSDGCSVTSNNVTVNVTLQPSAGFNWSIAGGKVVFTNLSSNASTYVWKFGDGDSSTTTHPTHTYTANGSYPAMLTATNSCGSNTATFNINITTISGIDNAHINVLEIFPNPAHQLVTISQLPAGKNITLKLADMTGKLIQSYQTNGAETLPINISSLAPGLYLLQAEGYTAYKLVKN